MKKYLVGIDIGTTGLKVSFFQTSGELVSRAYREYPLNHPHPGWAEIQPELWWDELCSALNEIYEQGKVSPNEVAGIGITCTNSLILLDSEEKPLIPAIMQLDQRAVLQAQFIKQQYGEELIFSKTGNRVASGAFWGPTLLWLQENYPSIYKKAKYFLVPTSYLVLRLTGKYCIDHSRASSTMLYNIHKKTWDDTLCNLFSMSKDTLPPIYQSDEVVGSVNSKGALATGFTEGTPVVAGAMDTVGALVGLGTNKNQGALIMGTVGRLCLETKHLDDRFMNTVNFNASNTLSMTPVNNAGVSYKWLKQLLFEGQNNSGDVYHYMDKLAEGVQPGSEGLLFMPYLMGERSPIWDQNARGCFVGLKMKHEKQHVVRAVLEGVGFALAQNFEIFKSNNKENFQFLKLGGGGAKSELWGQILSDILGIAFIVPEDIETETKGAAMLAGIGTGIFADYDSAKIGWVKMKRGIIPSMERHRHYQKLLPIFKEFYQANKQLYTQMNQSKDENNITHLKEGLGT